jgi:hypothetical protein
MNFFLIVSGVKLKSSINVTIVMMFQYCKLMVKFVLFDSCEKIIIILLLCINLSGIMWSSADQQLQRRAA